MKTKKGKSRSVNQMFDNLVANAQKELFLFDLNSRRYVVEDLIKVPAIKARVPYLSKLEKLSPGCEIINTAGYPVLKYTKILN